jgi:hypothetical protein
VSLGVGVNVIPEADTLVVITEFFFTCEVAENYLSFSRLFSVERT